MPSSYDLYIRHEVYEVLRGCSRSGRDRIAAFIESLPADPFQVGEFAESDRTGRTCQVKIIGKHAVFFWTDHAVKEVRVVDLIDADRA